jgi:electron transfer flavoprotein beta subunit
MENAMNIIVCMKQVPDPEGPPAAFQLDEEQKRVTPVGIPPVLSSYDENALEAALRIKEGFAEEAKITVLSMGKNPSKNIFIKTLAAGADEVVLVKDNLFDEMDSFQTAHALANGIRKIGNFDLILCGIQAADSNNGQVGIGVAELLGIPAMSMVHRIELVDGKVRMECVSPEGRGVFESQLPLLVTIGGEYYPFRNISIPAIIKAKKRTVPVWSGEDVGLSKTKGVHLISLAKRVSNRRCEIINGETSEAVGQNLARRLIESNII